MPDLVWLIGDYRELSLCKETGCNRIAFSRELCITHWSRAWYGGKLPRLVPYRPRPRGTQAAKKAGQGCAIEGCDKPSVARHLCQHHYYCLRAYGDPRAPEARTYNMEPVECVVAECRRDASARALCTKHYKRWYKHGDPMWRSVRGTRIPCLIDGCEGAARAQGLCHEHARQRARTLGLPALVAAA